MDLFIFIALILVTTVVQIHSQVTKHPQNKTVASGENATFSCSGKCTESCVLEWRLTSSDGNTSESLSALHITPTVEQVVFEFQLNGEERISRIRFEDVERYNGTTIQCALTGSFNNSPAATLRVFGPPITSTDLHATAPRVNRIVLSWSNLSPSYFPITYELLVTDNISGELINSTNTTDTSFQFTPPNGFCSVLDFSVQAFNRAGKSEAAELTYYGLVEPNVEETIQLNIRMIDGMLTGEIEFETTVSCEGFPVTYNLLLEEQTGNQSFNSPTPNFSFDLEENTKYSYTLEALVDRINISREIGRREFLTTDVQEASVTRATGNAVVVRCRLLLGSRSRGCHVQLFFDNGETQSQNIGRVGGSECVEEEIVLSGSGNVVLSQTLVFDWESDGSIGTVPVPLGDPECNVPTSVPVNGDDFPYLLPVVIAVPGGVLIIVLVLLIIITSCFITRSRHAKNFTGAVDESDLAGYSTTAKLNSYVHKNGHTVKSDVTPPSTEENYDQLSHPDVHMILPISTPSRRTTLPRHEGVPATRRVDSTGSDHVSIQPKVHKGGEDAPNDGQLYAEITEDADGSQEPVYSELDAARSSYHNAVYSQLGAEREYAVLESGHEAPPPLPAPYQSLTSL